MSLNFPYTSKLLAKEYVGKILHFNKPHEYNVLVELVLRVGEMV